MSPVDPGVARHFGGGVLFACKGWTHGCAASFFPSWFSPQRRTTKKTDPWILWLFPPWVSPQNQQNNQGNLKKDGPNNSDTSGSYFLALGRLRVGAFGSFRRGKLRVAQFGVRMYGHGYSGLLYLSGFLHSLHKSSILENLRKSRKNRRSLEKSDG